jgi:outer membrane receptor protein involved in Fe transport
VTSIAHGGQARQFDLDIPSSTVSEELKRLYEATGAPILYSDSWRMPARGIKGHFTAEEALTRILDHTGLWCEYLAASQILVRKFEAQPSSGKCLPIEKPTAKQIPKPTPEPQGEMEEVHISGHTGTRIAGLKEIGSPMLTWNAQQIRASGAQNLSDLLKDTTQNFGGGPTQQTHFGQAETLTNSFQGVSPNLRGLGSRATLVLLDGQPLAPSGTAAAVVDLLQIPLSAVESVEVMLDGASAFYGSDAVGGVINVHTEHDYTQPKTFVQVGEGTEGHQEYHRLSQEIGHRWDSGSAVLVGETMRQGALSANERWQSNSNLIPEGPASSPFYYTNPGNLVMTGSGMTYAIPSRAPGGTLDFSTLTPGTLNRANSYANSDVVPGQSRWSLFSAFQQKMGERATIFSTVLWSQRDALTSLGGQEVRLDVTQSPFLVNPPSDDVQEQYNLGRDLGSEMTRVKVRALNATVGTQIHLPGHWQMEIKGTNTREAESQLTYNAVDQNALQLAVFNPLSPPIRPDPGAYFDPFGAGRNLTAAMAEAVKTQLRYGSRSQLWDFALTANGPVLSLPAGPVHSAVGLEYRDQEFSSGVSQTASWSDLRRQRYAGYVEIAAPLLNDADYAPPLRSLMLSLAGRMEDYSDFGRAFAPRIGLTWEPVSHLTVSSTWSRSVRAPNMEDVFSRNNTSFVGVLGNTPVLIWYGGNPGLHVETGATRTLGLSFESDDEEFPLFSASVNYFDILFRDRVQQYMLSTDLLTNPDYHGIVTFNPSAGAQGQVCSQSRYLPGSDGLGCMAEQVGAIVDLRTQNTGRLWTDGIDVQLGMNLPVAVGRLGIGVKSTYISDYKEATLPAARMVSSVDTLSNPLAWHVIGTGDWSVGAFEASVVVRHTKGYRDNEVVPVRRVGAWTTGDVRVAYTFGVGDGSGARGVEVAVRCENVTGRYSPRVVNTVAGVGYDQENGSLVGRVVLGSVFVGF